MQRLTEFLRMGDFAAYVWPAYGFSLLLLFFLLANAFRSLRKVSKVLNTRDET